SADCRATLPGEEFPALEARRDSAGRSRKNARGERAERARRDLSCPARSGTSREAFVAIAIGKEGRMTYAARPLSCEPTKLRGLSEKLIVSHWENNYGGPVRRLNAITAQLAELDFGRAPIFMINGLKREELIATNSMILHELYFDGLGGDGISGGAIDEALARDFGSVDRWRAEFVSTGKALRGG